MQPPQKSKQERARAWVNGYTAVGIGIVVAAIVPGSTSVALIGIEVTMCYQIGKIYRGEKYTMQEATAAARVVGLVAITAQIIALEAMDFIPIAGWAVKGGVAGGVIKTLGEAIIKHYEKLEQQSAGAGYIEVASHSATPAQMNVSPPLLTATPPIIPTAPTVSIEERLRKLAGLHSQNLISQMEHDDKKRQILSEL